ncbi:MAG: hypothetical protein PVH61_35425 [Candidatus Aminicenantes bacterium]|jgi:hypothetical protein
MISLKFAAAVFLPVVLILIFPLLCLQWEHDTTSKENKFPIDINISTTDLTLTDSLHWEKFPSVFFIYRSEGDIDTEIWRKSSEVRISITLPEIEGNPLYMNMKGKLDRTIMESLQYVKDDFDAKYIPATLIRSEKLKVGKDYLFEVLKSGLDSIDIQKFHQINDACKKVDGQKPVYELDWTFYFIIKAKTGNLSYKKIFPVRYSISNSITSNDLYKKDFGFTANISDTEVDLVSYLSRGCFPAVVINFQSQKDGIMELWREPSRLEYPMPPFDPDEWSSDLGAMRVEMAMREFIRRTKTEFADKYGIRKLVFTAPVPVWKEYRFIIAPPDIQLFEPFKLNISKNACGNETSTISNNEGWEWTYNFTIKMISTGLKEEKSFSVRYKW